MTLSHRFGIWIALATVTAAMGLGPVSVSRGDFTLSGTTAELVSRGVNADFEAPALEANEDEEFNSDLGDGWSFNLVSGESSNQGLQNPATGFYGSVNPAPAPFEGNQIAFFNLNTFTQAELISDPIGKLLANESYTLNVAVGARNNTGWSDVAYRVGLRASDGTDLGSFATVTLDAGSGATVIDDLEYTLNSSSVSEYVGDDVRIVIGGYNTAMNDGMLQQQFTQGNVDNVRLAGMFGDPDAAPAAALMVNRATGAVTLSNTSGANFNIKAYSLSSEAGSLDAGEWVSIASTSASWEVLGEDATDLSEAETDGGAGTTLPAATPRNLGAVWLRTPFEDVQAEVLLEDGTIIAADVQYAGDAIPTGDLTGDGDITTADWTAFKSGQGTDFTGLSLAQAYLMGDLDGDLDHDLGDFSVFRTEFNAVNGAGAFAAMVASVPEPGAAVMLLLGGCLSLLGARGRVSGATRLAAAMLLAVCVFAVSGDAARADLLSRWSFDAGDATDEISGLNGIPVGAVNFVSDPERGDTVLELDGAVENYVMIDDPGLLLDFSEDGAHQGSATVTAWVRGPAGQTDWKSHGAIFSQGEWEEGISLTEKGDTDPDGQLWTRITGETAQRSDIGLPLDEWVHVAATWAYDSGADQTTVAYYVNGELTGFAEGDGVMDGRVMPPTDGISRIGLEDRNPLPEPTATARWAWEGRIDDLRVYDEALDQAGIVEAMFPLEASNLTLYVDLNSGQVTLTNETEEPIMLNSYRLTSDGDHLNAPGAQSITADSDFPVGDGSGNGWELGPNPSDGEIVEWYLTGDSMVDVGQRIGLGQAFDTSTPEGDRDLSFRYVNETGVQRGATIVYEAATGGVSGDYNSDGVVDAADYATWRDNLGAPAGTLPNDPNSGPIGAAQYDTWRTNYGAAGAPSGAPASVPEPRSAVLVTLAGALLAAFLLVRRREPALAAAPSHRAGRWVAGAVLLAAASANSVSAEVMVDRLYRMGEDGLEHASDGIDVGAGPDNANPGATLDSVGPSGSFQDLLAVSNGGELPVYEDLSGVGDGRTGLGIRFDGMDDFLSGFSLGFPPLSRGAINGGGSGTLNYNGVYERGFQLWVYPEEGGVSADGDRDIVMDTTEHGVRIDDDDQWSMVYSGSEVDSNVPVAFNEWSHLMVAIPQPAASEGEAYKGVMYLNGVAVAGLADGYSTDATDNLEGLALGANSGDGDTIGMESFFAGVLDELEMFVWGQSYDHTTGTITELGTFNFAEDNDYAADFLSGVAGDLDNDGTGPASDQDDIDALVAGWRNEKLVNGVLAGDLETFAMGDLNFDGATDLTDVGMMIQLLPAGASGVDASALYGIAQIPEPSASLLVALGAGLGLARRTRRAAGRPAA